MNFFDLINAVNAVFELFKNVSELPHTDKMPDMLFLFGLVVNPVKDQNKKE